MNMIKKINGIILGLTIILIAIVFIATGCSGYNVMNIGNGYQIFSVNRGLGKFSFEYSTKFTLNNVIMNSRHTEVFFDGPIDDQYQDITAISINIGKFDSGINDYLSAINQHLQINSNLINFRILEKQSINVDEEAGEEVAFYYLKDRPVEMKSKGIPQVPSVTRDVMFAHNNLLWWLEIDSIESSSDSANIDFEHIIQTFKILN